MDKLTTQRSACLRCIYRLVEQAGDTADETHTETRFDTPRTRSGAANVLRSEPASSGTTVPVEYMPPVAVKIAHLRAIGRQGQHDAASVPIQAVVGRGGRSLKGSASARRTRNADRFFPHRALWGETLHPTDAD